MYKRQQPDKHDHIVISTDRGYLIYNDPRRFGLFTYCESTGLKEHPLLKKLGPDPFERQFNGAYLYHKLQTKKIPVKVALLDQDIVAGIGNIYASETLYKAGVSPLRPANKVTLAESTRIVEAAREVLSQAIAAGGSTLKDYKKPDGSLGYFQNRHCVYNKTGQKCPQCTCDHENAGGIRKIIQAGRSSFYCPVKQK